MSEPRLTARKFEDAGYVWYSFASETPEAAVWLTLYHYKSPVYGNEKWGLRVGANRQGTTGCNRLEYLPKRFQVRPN